jgi:AraC family transcriptional regulator
MNNYNECMQKVLTTIERELEYVTIEELIRVAGYSYYHFHRIFKAYTGESLKKYIKRLQLEKALQQMQIDRENITQIAMRSGYNTPSSFNKAFKEMFAVNPSEYKQSLEPKRKLYKDIEPERIVRVEPIEVYTIRHVGDYEKTVESWEKIIGFAEKHRLFNKDFYAYAITYDHPDISDVNRLRCDVCISKTKEVDIEEEGIVSKKFDGGKYAVFLHKGDHEKLTETYDAIFGNWFYKGSVVLRDVPVIQKFLNDKRSTKVEELLTEVWVGI